MPIDLTTACFRSWYGNAEDADGIELGWFVLGTNDLVIGPRFARKQDADIAARVLNEMGLTPDEVDAASDQEWKAIRQKIMESLQW